MLAGFIGKDIQVGGEAMFNMDLNTERHECSATRPETDMHKGDEETKTNGVFEAYTSSVNRAVNSLAT